MAARCAACAAAGPYARCPRHEAERRYIGAKGIALCRAALREAHAKAHPDES